MSDRCYNCGNEVSCDASFSADEYGYEHDGVVTEYTCPSCGAMISVYVRFDYDTEEMDYKEEL